MATYTVEITRTATRMLQVQIEAGSAEEARISALDTAGDLAFPSEPDAEYEATVLGTPDTPLRVTDQVVEPSPFNESNQLLRRLLDNITIDDDGEPFWSACDELSPEDQASLVREAHAFLKSGKGARTESTTSKSSVPPEVLKRDLVEATTLLKTIYNDITIDSDGDGLLCGSRVDADDEDSDIEIQVLNETGEFLRRMEQAGIVANTGVQEVEREYAEIVEVLQASTAHLTKDEADFLITKDRYIPGSEGYSHIAANGMSVYLAINEGDELVGVSDGFREVAEYARAREIGYIRFDRDAPPVPGCTTYDW